MPHETTEPITSRLRHIPMIGIVGGIGSGKSTLARWVAEHANVLVIDADRLGHEVIKDGDVKSSLRQHFGDEIFDEQGEVKRSSLARYVFGEDAPSRAARQELQRIVHPAIQRRVNETASRAEREGYEAVLLDAAVLLEAGWRERCDAVVFVDAPDKIRLKRVQARSGWTADELRRREASQLSELEKRSLCDAVVSNSGDVSHGGQQLLDFLQSFGVVSCKPSRKSSQQSTTTSETLPPRS